LLNIDNKISPLPIWRCTSKSLCYFTFVYGNSNKQQLILTQFYVHIASSVGNQCQISAKSIKANNSHGGFCEVTPNTSVLSLCV